MYVPEPASTSGDDMLIPFIVTMSTAQLMIENIMLIQRRFVDSGHSQNLSQRRLK